MGAVNFSDYFRQEESRILSEWCELLRFQSIGTQPEYDGECERCVNWLMEHVRGMGFSAELLPTSGKPVLYGHLAGPANAPTVLFYGHYDVQPVDPLELWTTPPFEPQVRDGRMYARGAQDNKGQLFYFLKAAEALIKHKKLNCSLKLLLEGEEEYGSGGITESLPGWAKKVAADVLMVCDTGAFSPELPIICVGLRGVMDLTITLRGPNTDLHSGMYGGVVRNPAMELARLLATIHDENGRIAVPGYYDGIKEPTEEERSQIARFPFDAKEYERTIGVAPLGGEKGLTAVERNGFRPTIEVNGIHSGYGGPGRKTIIPAEALAKITCRNVMGQDPVRCLTLLMDYLKSKTPEGVTLELSEFSTAAPAAKIDLDKPSIKKAVKVLKDQFGAEPLFEWNGASIPIVAELAKITNGDALLVGFGLNEDAIHAPNESFRIDQFRSGFMYVCSMLQSLGE